MNAHLDAVTFRGIRYENSPVWLQNVMGKSGLFTDYLEKMAQVITWWYLGENGTFTYWPDGPLEPPDRLEHPLWNKGVVVQNELMFHRGDPVGGPASATCPGSAHRSCSVTTRATTLGDHHRRHAIRTLPPEGDAAARALERPGVRRHGRAEDVDGPHRRPDARHGLRTAARRHAREGCRVAEPSDPLHDSDFIRALIATYTIAPTTDWATPDAA